MKPLPRAAVALIAVTIVLATPYVVLGAKEALDGHVRPEVAVLLLALAVLLSLRPIRVQANTELSASDIAVLAGIVLLPVGAIACVAALARVVNDVLTRKRPPQIVRNATAVAVATGSAAIVYNLLLRPTAVMIEPVAATIIASVSAAIVLVALDVGQIVLLQKVLGNITFGDSRQWIERTIRAQLLWGLAAVIAVQIVIIEPWFLVPGIPLFMFGYMDVRARFVAERRARLLATLVEVGHAVGTSLDPVEVFRQVLEQVRKTVDVDAFYVASVVPGKDVLLMRYQYDDGKELPSKERPLVGTLAGVCVQRDQAILLRDAPRDRARLGLPERSAWGNALERSIMVAPLRLHGRVIGAVSVRSRRDNAYDEGDLELLSAIANEAAIAIERADLYERTTSLSRRLFDLSRIGIELAEHKELPHLVKALADSVKTMMGASVVAVYLDTGGDRLEFSVTTGKATSDVLTLSKKGGSISRVVETREPVQVHVDDSNAPDSTRKMLKRFGHESILLQPLRLADKLVGVVFITWQERHVVTDEEAEIIGVLSGIGAAAIRSIGLYRELDEAYLSTVSTLTATIEARDAYREDHQRRVAADAVALGERLHLPEGDLRELRYASLFHSLGKIGVPASILGKRGQLTTEERAIVQEHPLLGARILESIRFLRGVVPIVKHANERWDGSGYPDGLMGEAIPLPARILNVVISYHAMLADRPYRPALPADAALGELRRLSGVWYEPSTVDVFISMIEARGVIEAAEEEVGTSRELSILAELTPEFHSLLDLDQLLQRLLGILERNIPGASFTILLRDQTSGDLLVRAAAGAWTTIDSPSRLQSGRGISGWVLEHREAAIVDDVRGDPRYLGDPQVRAMLAVPLVSGGRAIGVLVLSHRKVAAFSKRDLTLMQAVGAQIAAAIDVAELHERLKRAANTDALTGLHNYRYFYDRLEEEIARAARHSAMLAVAFFDLDKLKSVNDTYGHLAGNEVLKRLGEIIGAQVRTEDVPARYGGDEFAIVMPDTPRDEAEHVVLRLMEKLDHAEVELPDGRRIAMPELSWGVASYPLDGHTARELVENADTRAYARKRSR